MGRGRAGPGCLSPLIRNISFILFSKCYSGSRLQMKRREKTWKWTAYTKATIANLETDKYIVCDCLPTDNMNCRNVLFASQDVRAPDSLLTSNVAHHYLKERQYISRHKNIWYFVTLRYSRPLHTQDLALVPPLAATVMPRSGTIHNPQFPPEAQGGRGWRARRE